LAFKPETDDIREAPALYIINELLGQGAAIKVFDPEAMPNVKKEFGDKIEYTLNKDDATIDADALIICTEWSMFRTPNFEKVRSNLRQPVIFDGRNLYDLEEIKNEGFYYSSIGRKTVEQ
jgi:UDPglucose 6-dehydrogenase